MKKLPTTNYQLPTRQSGLAAITITIVVLLIAGTIATTFVFVFLNRIESARNVGLREQAYFTAESGAEDALLRIIDPNQNLPAGIPYVFSVGDSSVSVDVQGGNKILADGTANNRTRRVAVDLNSDTDDFNFSFAALVGNGGIFMQNGATIDGDLHANGNIEGNGNGEEITGDTTAAGTSIIDGIDTIGGTALATSISGKSNGNRTTIGGDANAVSLIENVDISGDAHANSLSTCSLAGGDIKYVVLELCDGEGSSTQVLSGANAADERGMPISDETIEGWEDKAENESGGVISSTDPECVGGEYLIDSSDDGTVDLELGGPNFPGKIECDLKLQNHAWVRIHGFVWITGNLIMDNNAVLFMDRDFGGFSSAVMVHDRVLEAVNGVVRVQNNAKVKGACTPDTSSPYKEDDFVCEDESFLMVVSMNNAYETLGSGEAIGAQNSAASAIYYAPHGLLTVDNQSTLSHATAYRIEMQNGTTIIYDDDLQNLSFSDNEDVAYFVSSWQEE